MNTLSACTSIFAFRVTATVCLALHWTSLSLATNDIINPGGFEGFSDGPLQGQFGWLKSGLGTGTATVQDSMFESGLKGVQVDRAANADERWAVPVGGMGFPNHRYILVDWDMNITSTGAASGTGPFFGVETYDDTTSLKLLGSLGVDATSGDVLYQAQSTGFFTDSGASINPGQWHHFQIQLDFFLDQYKIFLDFGSAPLATVGFVDGATDDFTDADIAAVAAAFDGTSQSLTATAFFDNFLVRNVSRADFDIDTDVDAADLSLWEDAFGTSDGADADLDGDSDGADFLIWQRDFDSGVGPLGAPSVTVPEPGFLALAIFPLFAGLRFRRRNLIPCN